MLKYHIKNSSSLMREVAFLECALRACLHKPYLFYKLGFQQLEQKEVPKVVGPNLVLEPLPGISQGACHDPSIADEHINLGLLTELLCKAGYAVQVGQIQLGYQNPSLRVRVTGPTCQSGCVSR